MFKFVAILALALAANAQVLRISPAIIGASGAGTQQVIQLGAGGSRGVLLARPYAARQLIAARPIAIAQPIRLAQPIQRLVAVAPQVIARPISYAIDESPKPYAFAFSSTDETGATHSREEQANGSGAVTGSYTIQDSLTGANRVVTYIADENGYRAEIKTNEPGTQTSAPAGAVYQSTAGRR